MSPPSRRLSPVARRVWMLTQLAFWGAVTVAAVIVFISAGGRPWFLIPLLVGVTATISVPRLRWARWRWDLTEEGIDIQNGAISVNRTLIPWVRVQHVETQRGVFEQIFGLATVIVHNAAAAHTIPLLAQVDAEELRERIAARAKTDDDE